ncbi:YidC/Oxa1 family membrane protein insertase [Streptacidiphilus sp. EB103A]|uniref:YidC/Oxa1 family membrane protein insertase n=1 Tax=Streptacidiphilus sp. EB103A TaxID=3156275 RepID=UPI0035140504
MSVFAFLDAPTGIAQHLVTGLASAVHPLLGVSATAAAIVVFTLLVRLALHPLSRARVRGERTRTRLAPQLAELNRRHKGKPEALRAAQAELYRTEGVSPLAGCLPMLLQWPVFSVMYRLFTLRSLGGHANALLTRTLAGVPLGAHLQSAGPGHLPVFLTLYALLAALGYLGWRRARRTMDPATPGAAILPYLSFGTVVFAVIVPLAAGLYLLTTTAWTMAENAHLERRGKEPVSR